MTQPSEEKFIVLIEDEPDQAALIRGAIDFAVNDGDLRGKVTAVLPARQKAYPRMEDFVDSDESNPHMNGVVIVDLFLRAPIETPAAVFHQLMYSIFPSPTDASLVCGRIGVLEKLRAHYHNAHIELFTYVPTYLETQNEPVRDKRCPYLYPDSVDQHTINQFLKARLHDARDLAKQRIPDDSRPQIDHFTDPSLLNLLQTLAMRDAIYERIRGVFLCRDITEHLTQAKSTPNRKTLRNMETDIKVLIAKLAAVLSAPSA